jgi:hypothetical protein
MGTVGYLLGDPFAYVQIQKHGWQNQWTLPFTHVLRDLTNSFNILTEAQIPPLGQMMRPLLSLATMLLLAWSWRDCDPAFLLYVIASMIFIHAQEPSRSTPRYELVLFPVYLAIARVMSRRPRLTWLASPTLAVMQVVLFIRHISWRWVA